MKISTRLKFAGSIGVGLVIAIGAVLLTTTQQVKQELIKNEVASEVLKSVTNIRYLTLEYVLRHEERARAQRQMSQASLVKVLADATHFLDAQELAVVEELRGTGERVDALFGELVVNQRERQTATQNIQVLEELDSRLTGQIVSEAQTMIAAALSLSQISRAGVLRAQQQASLTVAAFGAIVLFVIA